MFEVGQKVVCIKDDFDENLLFGVIPTKKGEVYTVREVEMTNLCGLILRFEEIRNIKDDLYDLREIYGETGYYAHWFRPVEELKTDISIFQKIDEDVFGKETV